MRYPEEPSAGISKAYLRRESPLLLPRENYGGISIIKEYKMERTLLSFADMQDVLAGLGGLDSVWGNQSVPAAQGKAFFSRERGRSSERAYFH